MLGLYRAADCQKLAQTLSYGQAYEPYGVGESERLGLAPSAHCRRALA